MKYFDINIFSKLDEKKLELEKAGREIINLSVGTPDLSPDEHVVVAMKEASADTDNFKYSLDDMPELIGAVQAWYKRRYGVSVDGGQITSVYGSQEGLAHIAFPLCDPGDIVLVPQPGYPIFEFGPRLAGAKIEYTPLLEKNDYLVDFDAIPEETAKKAKMIIVSYPNNPVTATAPYDFYVKLVDWAKTYDIAVVHDNAYSDLVLYGEPGISFLSVPGAMDVGVEFNSLSKSYNMTGLRIAFALGNEEIMHGFKCVRSQIDYGISYPVQIAAIAALDGPQDILARNREFYRSRMEALCSELNKYGWDVRPSQATMFLWAPLPKGYTSSFDFAFKLADKTGVLLVPGASFGPYGEGFVRIAAVQDAGTLKKAARLIGESGLL